MFSWLLVIPNDNQIGVLIDLIIYSLGGESGIRFSPYFISLTGIKCFQIISLSKYCVYTFAVDQLSSCLWSWSENLRPPPPPPSLKSEAFNLFLHFFLLLRKHGSAFAFLCALEMWQKLPYFNYEGGLQIDKQELFRSFLAWIRLGPYEMVSSRSEPGFGDLEPIKWNTPAILFILWRN